MTISRNPPVEYAAPLCTNHGCAWSLKRISLVRPRLISNLLALVALFSIGFM